MHQVYGCQTSKVKLGHFNVNFLLPTYSAIDIAQQDCNIDP